MRTKSIDKAIADTEEPEHRLKKNLGALDLTVFGVGITLGSGLFVLTGQAAKTHAGPAISLSFLIAAIGCVFAALCYAEFASTIPVAGSAYTFSFVTLGEFVAWIVGWDLILELFVAASAVAGGWSGYLQHIVAGTPLEIPEALGNSPAAGGVLDLPAGLLVLALTVILVLGVKLSSRVNQIGVIGKVGAALLFVIIGVFFVKGANLTPYIPAAEPRGEDAGGWLHQPLIQVIAGIEPTTYGFGGVLAGAALVFFSFIGFDVVATTAEEARRPQRDLPIGIIASLGICAGFYIIVSTVMAGMQDYRTIDPNDPAPIASALTAVGQGWAAKVVSIGAAIGITVVVMILLLGLSRVTFAMSRDGLLPSVFSKVHPKFRTPWVVTTVVGVGAAVLASFSSIGELGELVNIGTLAAFVMVSVAVIVLRRTKPNLKRAFRTPFVPLVPILAIIICFVLMLNLVVETWFRFMAWMVVGLLIYFLYSRRHSKAREGESLEDTSS